VGHKTIKVEGLSKQYRLGVVGTGAINDDINRWWYRVRGKEDPFLKIGEVNDRTRMGGSDYIWALRNICFEVNNGEVLGIIGRNGAGKSTLLKILSRTTAPTAGSVKIKGRVASLLEVGTGFHPELTGRENIYLNGAILGMTKKEIKGKFDEIVDFSGVERYIDTPVKRYSSGMYVRLAFAVAAHLDPEILIIDEVLAVGDVEFQKKCLGKMKDASEKDGRTVLFVSHQMDAITRLCNRVLVIDKGVIGFEGLSHDALTYYIKGTKQTAAFKRWDVINEFAPGNQYVRLLEVKVANLNDRISEVYNIDEPIKVTMKYEVLVDGFVYTHGFNLYDGNGVHILSSHNVAKGLRKEPVRRGIFEANVFIPGNLLSDGLHQASVAIMSYNPFTVHFHEMEAVSFSIREEITDNPLRDVYGGKIPGIVRPVLNWEFKDL